MSNFLQVFYISSKMDVVNSNWLKTSFLLCIFGFLKEIRPSEPFIYEFLIGPWRNITTDIVQEQVYPIGTYSYLAQSIIIFLITDLCKYKPLIICLALCGVIIWGMLLWTESLWELQILEVFYGTFMATEVAYYTYIYAKVDTNYYQLVTSHTRAALLAGRALSSILAQLLVSFKCMDYRDLNYITFSAMLLATIWSFLLPPVKKTIYFHQEKELSESFMKKVCKAFNLMKNHCITSFSNGYVLKWSLFWSLSTCGFIQIQTYMQPLWYAIQSDPNQQIFNGAVEAVLTVLGFLGALIAGYTKFNWQVKGDLILTIYSILIGFILLYQSQTNHILFSYVCYILNGGFYYFMITIASAEIAKFIPNDSYGLIFGLNTFFALVFQVILTVIVVSNLGFALAPREQYFVYGVFHIVIAVCYIFIGLFNWLFTKRGYFKPNT